MLWNIFRKILNHLLTHWGRVTHICVVKLAIIGSDHGLSPGRRQAIIWTNAGILLIGPLGTNFSENLIEILTFSFTKMRLKVSSAKWRPFCLGLNVLKRELVMTCSNSISSHVDNPYLLLGDYPYCRKASAVFLGGHITISSWDKYLLPKVKSTHT